MTIKKTISIVSTLVIMLGLYLIMFREDEIRATLHFPKRSFNIEDSNSVLLKILLSPDDFPVQFTWYGLMVTQGNSATNNDDNQISQGATSILLGFQENKKIGILNEVKQYKDVSYLRTDNILEFQNKYDTEFNLDNIYSISKSDYQKYGCVLYDNTMSLCKIVVGYSDVVVKLDIKFYETVDRTTFVKTINTILEALEKKLITYPQ